MQEALTERQQIALIYELFPDLTSAQKEQLEALGSLYREWNAKINLISRKDIDNLYLHHVLHSLGITEMLRFTPGTVVLDAGTGGGFPGIPLAILFPEVRFILVDSTQKKIKAAQAVAEAVKLENVCFRGERLEAVKAECHFVVSRAALPLTDLDAVTRHLFVKEQLNALPNGIIALKGGQLTAETAPYRNSLITAPLYPALRDEYFKEKQVVYIPINR